MPDYSNHTPTSRTEMILKNMVDGTEITLDPQSAVEYLLIQLNDKMGPGGGSLKPAGSKTFENLGAPSEDELGNIYNITNDFISNQYFIDGSSKSYKAGTNVYCIVQKDPLTEEDAYWWDIFGASIDLSEYLTKDEAEETYAESADLATVATSGSYNDLSDIPENSATVKGFKTKVWGGNNSFQGKYIWRDGDKIYYSYSGLQRELNVETGTWSDKTWNGLTNFNALNIWTDGSNIYYSTANTHYKLNRETSTWESVTWTGLTNFTGEDIWTDGDHIYYDSNNAHYELNVSAGEWSVKTWNGTLKNFYARYIWKIDDHIYYDYGGVHYELNKETSTWTVKTWTGIDNNFSGNNVWTDGNDYYWSNNDNQYILDKENSSWSEMLWAGIGSFNGEDIWTDGNNYYWSITSNQYELTNVPIADIRGVPYGIATLNNAGRIPIEQTNYVNAGRRGGTTVGTNSTAEGYNTQATAQNSHAEGNQTQATGAHSHAEGTGTKATGQHSHAEGLDTTASHAASHSSGYNTITGRNYQSVTGSYNKGSADTLFEVGNGTSINASDRHNAFEVNAKNGVKIGDTTITAISTGARGNYNLTTYQPNTIRSTPHSDYTGYWVKFNVGDVTMKEGLVPQTYQGITVDTTVTTADGTNTDIVKVITYADTLAEGGIVVEGDIIDGDGNVLSNKLNSDNPNITGTLSMDGINIQKHISKGSKIYTNVIPEEEEGKALFASNYNSYIVDFIVNGSIVKSDIIPCSYNGINIGDDSLEFDGTQPTTTVDIYEPTADGIQVNSNVYDDDDNKLSNKIDKDAGFGHTSDITYNPDTKTVICSKDTDSYNSQIYSKSGYKDNVFVTFKVSQKTMGMVIGLDSNPTEGVHWSTIDYAFYIVQNGSLGIFENGIQISAPAGHTTYDIGDEFRLEYSDGYVRYYHNGELIRSVARPLGDPLYLDSSIYSKSGSIYDLVFGTGVSRDTGNPIVGTAVNITGYTQNNPYTTPCDGYFQLYSRTTGRFLYGAISLDGGTVNVIYFGATNANGTAYNSVYVPKGAKIYMMSTDDNNGYGTFYPILNRP